MAEIEVIVVSGPRGPAGAAGASNITGQFPIFYDAGSGIVGITSGVFVTPTELLAVSGALTGQGSTPGITAPSGYATGLFTGPTDTAPLFRSTVEQVVEVLGAGASGSQPPVTNLNMLVLQPIRGSTGTLLGEPDGWWSVLVSGRSARVPYYYS